jgi:HTH-type transcriptional regulator/antitoxin HigA
MITNDRQYKITNSQINKMEKAIHDLRSKLQTGSPKERKLNRIQLEAVKSEYDILKEQMDEYESLKSGNINQFEAKSLLELPQVLIKARIANGLSQNDLAKLLSLKEQQIQRYEADMYSSASLQRLSEVADVLNLKISEIAEFKTDKLKGSLDWKKFPIEEMYRRYWFQNFDGTLDEALSIGEKLVEGYIKSVYNKPDSAFTRKHERTGSLLNSYSLYAWQCRIASLAQSEQLDTSYANNTISSEWLTNLVRLSSKEDGPRAAKEYLKSSGIHLVIEPHLQKTFLDGAAILLPDGSPVIGMTIRYDRLDNFWFVLLHELAHITLHLKFKKSDCYFDDLDTSPDEIETDADNFANETLLPKEIWETSLTRYTHNEESIIELATDLNISPAIIAGRIRKEINNYTMYNNLIGLNRVRIQFPDINFGQ